ncbi:hypothetical protein Cgig2_020421 [Carnegiea gigantea]|uniref:Major facilitator superfamily (MFS) profile domain-containing protein n=1 Tax=Carnegiea gigantea TaxID=171969 RepID=A0A9Q1K6T0_9CARY|nr:hypothetical protein Cgig2_020421 [Carnegiea gigantea]
MPGKPDLLNFGGAEHHIGGCVAWGRVIYEVLTWLRFQALPVSSILPFLYNMVRDFHIAKREEDISFYAGFEVFYILKDLHTWLEAVLWGMIADRYGRKPVMLTSILGIVVFNTLFGLSINYWMAMATRFFIGALCGILGPIKAYSTEVCRREHQALRLVMATSSWGIGLVMGPVLGGYLAEVSVLPSFSGDISHFVGCNFSMLLAPGIASLLPRVYNIPLETLHNHSNRGKIQDEPHDVEDVAISTLDDDQKQKSARETAPSWLTLLKNWPYMSTLIGFSVFQLQDMAYAEIFSLWTVTPRSIGGVGLTSVDVGQALAVSGVGLLLCQVLIYPTLEKYFGPITITRVGAVLSIALLSSFPFVGKLSGVVLIVLIDLASMLKNAFALALSSQSFVFPLQTQQQRGTAGGLSLCLMSFCKAISPAAAGYLNASDGSFPSSCKDEGYYCFFQT